MKLLKKINNLIKCLFSNHEWQYTGKDVFKCNHCGKKIEK